MLYETAEQYDEAIEQTQRAITRILVAGQERNLETAGNKRETIEANLRTLRQHLNILQAEKQVIAIGHSSSGACYIGAGW